MKAKHSVAVVAAVVGIGLAATHLVDTGFRVVDSVGAVATTRQELCQPVLGADSEINPHPVSAVKSLVCKRWAPSHRGLCMTLSRPVPVRAYVRRRLGRVEHVRKHFRSYPRR